MPVYLVSYDVPEDVEVSTKDIRTFLEELTKTKDKIMPILDSVVLINCNKSLVSLKKLLSCKYSGIHWFISKVNRDCQIINPVNNEVEKWIDRYIKTCLTNNSKIRVTIT